MGLAVYNSIILDIRFPPCCYKKLLSPAVVPFHNPNASVGLAQLGLQDLMDTMPVSLLNNQQIMAVSLINCYSMNTRWIYKQSPFGMETCVDICLQA